MGGDPGVGNEAEGWFEADDATPGGGDPDGTALVGAEGEVDDGASYLCVVWWEGRREGRRSEEKRLEHKKLFIQSNNHTRRTHQTTHSRTFTCSALFSYVPKPHTPS